MGNSLGHKKTTKVMKINGEEMKLKTPIQAREILKDYPDHVLLESEAVKHYGTRAKPLEPSQELRPKRLYFLVLLPKPPVPAAAARRVRSGINMSAKDRLESLMLSRRSASDLSLMKPSSVLFTPEERSPERAGVMRVKMRLPRAQLERLMKESKDGAEAAGKIVDLCLVNNNNNNNNHDDNNNENYRNSIISGLTSISEDGNQQLHQVHSNIKGTTNHHHQKRVSFRPINEGEIQIAVA